MHFIVYLTLSIFITSNGNSTSSSSLFNTEKALASLHSPKVTMRITAGQIMIPPNQKDNNLYTDCPNSTELFINQALKPNDIPNEILEIGPGKGFLLARVFGAQAKKEGAPQINYTIVEPDKTNLNTSKKMYQSHIKKDGNSLRCFHKTSQDYFTTAPETKISKFNLVGAFLVPHYWNPISFINQIDSIHNSLKDNGVFCFTTRTSLFTDLSKMDAKYHNHYIQNIAEGNPMGFWYLNDSKFLEFTADPITMRYVIESLGFDVVLADTYLDINEKRHASEYLSITAKKSSVKEKKIEELLQFSYTTLNKMINKLSTHKQRKALERKLISEKPSLKDNPQEMLPALFRNLYKTTIDCGLIGFD